MTKTEATKFVSEIKIKCSECFPADKVKASKQFGKWVININGGSGACYGKTVDSVESAESILSIFANS